jgi:hypothetical protein
MDPILMTHILSETAPRQEKPKREPWHGGWKRPARRPLDIRLQADEPRRRVRRFVRSLLRRRPAAIPELTR